jgi:Bifunctional DNA primase/polymerase, N-terminal/DnaB-like helicase C terminal domain
MLRHALDYLSKGLSVIPLCRSTSLTTCDTPWGDHLRPHKVGKIPKIKWTEFQQRRASLDEVKEWFAKWPNANIGIVTGSISGLVVVDLDGPAGLASATELGLKSTVTSITGRGKHLWYKAVPGQITQNSTGSFPGLDIRGVGGYVVAPPSVHPNGIRYRWLGNVNTAMASLPPIPTVFMNVPVQTISARNETGWLAAALGEMKNGNIDDTLFRICSRLRNDGYSSVDTLALLQPHADKVGADAGHLQSKIDNVWKRYQPRSTTGIDMGPEPLTLHSPNNNDSQQRYVQLHEARPIGFGTGYPKFDTLSKGLKAGEVLTVAARTGVGKTNFILTPIRTFCTAGKKVLLFSTEMSFDQIWSRYIATLISPEEFESHKFFICDEFTPNITRIEEAIKHVKPDLFIFDHISHIGTDYHLISAFMSNVKRLARLFNIPAIVTAQLNRNADWVENGERVTPRMSMIQGSGAIEQMSAQVLLLSEKRIYPDYVEIDGVIDKNRHGDKGLIKFALKKNPYRIEEL